MAAPSHLRLFFALWPESRQRAALVDAIAPILPLSGRPVPPENLHVTLAFLGSIDASRLPRLEAVVDPLVWPSLDIVFDRVAYWQKARLMCLEASRPPVALTAAVAEFHQALTDAGFEVEPRPFRPHVTLVRNLEPSIAAMPARAFSPPFSWSANGIALVRSTQQRGGSLYTEVRRWP